MKTLILIASTLALVGCGSSGTSYQTTGEAIPEVPQDGGAFVVSSNNGSTSAIQYTQLNDGSILVQCGDGDGYSCQVYTAEQLYTDGEGGASASGGCGSSDCN